MRDEGLELSLEGRKRTRRVEEKAREGRRGGEMRGLTSGLLAEAEERGRWAQRGPGARGARRPWRSELPGLPQPTSLHSRPRQDKRRKERRRPGHSAHPVNTYTGHAS